MRYAILIAGAWCLSAPWLRAVAQGVEDDLRFQHITTADGLTDNRVTCLLQDGLGSIWIGTERGLDHYDGQTMEHFTGPDAPTASRISSLALDSAGSVWAGTTDAGLFGYRPHTRSFVHFAHDVKNPRSLPSNHLNHVLALNDSLLVICTQDAGVLWFNTRSGRWTAHRYPQAPRTPYGYTSRADASWYHSTARLDRDRLWLGFIPGGNSYVVDAWNGQILREVRSVHGDSLISLTNAKRFGQEILAGGWGPGISRIPLDPHVAQSFVPLPDEVTALVSWNGMVLAGTKINGLVMMNKDLQLVHRFHHLQKDPTALVNDRVRALMKDRQGNLWVGTAGGLCVHAPSVWRMQVTGLFPPGVADQPDLVFHAIKQCADGSVRIATSHGFFTWSGQGEVPRWTRLTYGGTPLEITDFIPLDGNEWAIGTETGVFRYDPRWETQPQVDLARHGPKRKLTMYQVRSMVLDTLHGKPLLLVGALGFGQSLHDARSLQEMAWQPGTDIDGQMIHSSATDGRGNFWHASDQGIVRWRLGKKSTVDSALTFNSRAPGNRHLPSDQASMVAIRNDTLWASMLNAAMVCIVRGNAVVHVPPRHLARTIHGFTFDGKGHIWCSTDNGLLRYDPGNDEWLQVPLNDGREFNGLNACITTLRNGQVACCANNCLITFDPGAFDRLSPLPAPAIGWITNSWGKLEPDAQGRLDLPYRNASFEAGFTALSTVGPQPLTFLYRLEDVENEPHTTSAAQAVHYAGLPVGTHRLLVSVRDAYGRTGPERALLTLVIPGPLWQHWWFYALLAVAASGAVFAWSRHKLRQALGVQAVRDGIARDLHDDIGSTLGSISFYSETLKRQIGAENDSAREVAEQIGQNSREMIDRMGDIVWSIDPRNDSTGSLEERMRTYATGLLVPNGIDLRFRPADADLAAPLNARTRRVLFLIFKEAVHNALKYAECTQIELELRPVDGHLLLRVVDNGCGFDLEQARPYNGNGLRGMTTRASSVGGTAEVRSAPGEGTEVKVRVPL